MPAWKRWLGAVLFMAGGGLCAAWGVHDTAAWISSLRRGDGVIRTDNIILGLPLLGGGICALGPAFIIPRSLALWSDKVSTRVVGALIGSMMAGVALTLLGGLVIGVTMEYEGYSFCSVRTGTRGGTYTWAGAGKACPPAPPRNAAPPVPVDAGRS